jgi:hypothetical protein
MPDVKTIIVEVATDTTMIALAMRFAMNVKTKLFVDLH